MANLLLILWLLGAVLHSEVYGAKTASVKDSTNMTDLLSLKITREFSKCSSSDSKCMIKCSVHSVQRATLTLYKENQICSQVTVFDLNPNPSLHLEVENPDKNSYRCVLNSPIRNQTKHLNITELCEPCQDITQTAVSVKEGDPVTLQAYLKDIKKETHVLWRFGPDGILIGEILENIIRLCDCLDGIFRDRLLLNTLTGDLTITNTSKSHSGIYKLQVNNQSSSCWSYNVTVSEPLPSPQISNHSNHCPSSSSECVLECSVENVIKGNLSLYKENRLLSGISVSELNYLCLDLDYKDNGNYSCVVSNSFINETKYLIISELCSGANYSPKALLRASALSIFGFISHQWFTGM